MAEPGQDTGFDMQSNAAAPVDAGTAATMVKEAAQGGTDDGGQARADAKQVDDKTFKEEFEIGHEETGEKDGTAETQTEVETDETDDDKGELEDKGEQDDDTKTKDDDADATKAGEKGEKGEEVDDAEPIGDWLKDVDEDTRQEILDEFIESNADLSVTVRQDGQDVEMTIAELQRAAGGYAGEEAIEKKIADARTAIKAQQDDLKSREEFLGKQLKKPADLLEFLDSNVEDPVQYYTAVRDHAESVLKSAEDDPAGFRRETSQRRASGMMLDRLEKLASVVDKLVAGKTGTPDAETTDEQANDEVIRKEGEARRKFVSDAGFKVPVVQAAWIKDKEPSDFYRWFARWIKTSAKDTSTRAKKSTKKNQRRGGKTLRRRGGSTPGAGDKKKVAGTPSATEMADFLVNHPTNKGRL